MSVFQRALVVTAVSVLLVGLVASADWEKGKAAFEQGDWATAEAEFLEVVSLHPAYAGGYYMLGLTQLRLDKEVEACANLARAHQLDPDNPSYSIGLASALSRARRHEEAVQLLAGLDATGWTPAQLDAASGPLAEAAISARRSGAVAETLERWTAEAGESPWALYALGRLRSDAGSYETAIDAYARVLELAVDDERVSTLAVEGAAAVAREAQRRGQDHFRRVSRLAVDLALRFPSLQSCRLAAETLLEVGELGQAATWFDRALEWAPRDPDLLFSSAVVHHRLGHLDQALERLHRALDSGPKPPLLQRIQEEIAAISEETFDLEQAARFHYEAGNSDRAREVEQLAKELEKPLVVRKSLAEESRSLRAAALDLDRGGDLGGAEEAGQRASELEEQVAVVDRELERARAELASGGQRVDGRRVAERVRWALRARSEATGPAALGLTPLASEEELLVIARDDRPEPGGQAGGPPSLAAVEGEGREIPFPLRETAVRARVDAYIATVEVEQRYDNPYATKVEAVYTFPLPQDAAVDEFLMTIGERRIHGIIREREQAEQIYLEARRKGHVASLLTQERPNVFTQRVANLEPGHSVDIQLTYYATLPYRDGGYELCIPAVVGPRFNPPGSAEGIAAAPRGPGGSTGQPSEVQYLKPGESSGHTMTLVVDLDAGVAVEELSSSSHRIQVETVGDSRRRISLAQGAVVPNRDFLLRWKVAGDQVKAAFLQHRDERGGYFTMVITPPSEEVSPPRPPAEHILVVDCSGSMQGAPLEQAKRAATRVLERLGPDDAFQVIRFSSQASALGPKPVAATPEAVRRGLDFVNSLDSGGGTMMAEGVKAAFDLPPSGRVRLVSLLTDGFIGNEAEILAAVHARLGSSRIFSFGVGTSPNRYLLEHLARVGRGAVAYLGLDDGTADAAVDAYLARVARPVLSQVTLDWQGMTVSDVYPSHVPDLFANRPVVVTGRFHGQIGTGMGVKASRNGEPFHLTVPLSTDDRDGGAALAKVWARMKVSDLADRSLWEKDRDRLVRDIRELALSYGLMSRYTAFLAVDSSSTTAGDHGVTVTQPVPVPAGVRYETTVGGSS